MKAGLTFLLFSVCSQCCSALSASTLRIEVPDGKKKCIGQDFDEGDSAMFKIGAMSASNEGHSSMLTVTISDPEGVEIVEEKIKISDTDKSKEIPVTIESHGVHELCFKYQGQTGTNLVKVNFGIELQSKRAKGGLDPSKRVGKDELPSLESELLAAEESLNDISREIEFARKQEILLTEATESTGSRVQWFSIFSMVILFITSLWQIIYLRHFFTSKKIL